MTRFKELKRIERAIRENDAEQLTWALSYCRSRLSIAPTKSQRKYWTALIAEVEAVLVPSAEAK